MFETAPTTHRPLFPESKCNPASRHSVLAFLVYNVFVAVLSMTHEAIAVFPHVAVFRMISLAGTPQSAARQRGMLALDCTLRRGRRFEHPW